MSKIILYHKTIAPIGEAVDRNVMRDYILSGWVTGPHEFDKTPEEILNKPDPVPIDLPKESHGPDCIILYHEEHAKMGLAVKMSLIPKLFKQGWVTSPEYFYRDISQCDTLKEKIDRVLSKSYLKDVPIKDMVSMRFIDMGGMKCRE